jgi:hypothetical protein
MFGIPCCGGYALRRKVGTEPLKVFFRKDSLVTPAAGWLGHKLGSENVVDPIGFHVQDRGYVLQGQ